MVRSLLAETRQGKSAGHRSTTRCPSIPLSFREESVCQSLKCPKHERMGVCSLLEVKSSRENEWCWHAY